MSTPPLVRVLLVVVPAQAAGVVLGALALPFQLLAAHPALGWLLYVFPAVLAGLALGLVLRPGRDRLLGHAAWSAVVGAVGMTLLLVVAHAAGPGGGGRSLLADVVPAVPLVALLQTAMAVLLWRRRP